LTDPRVALRELLLLNWALDFVPIVSADWYESHEETPQVTIAHILTRPEPLGFSHTPEESQRRFRAVYSIDVWSRGDQAKRWNMLREVDRIIHSNCMNPGETLDFAEVSDWRDLDEPGKPNLYRSQVRVEVIYYA
jgi:hypothetical protein